MKRFTETDKWRDLWFRKLSGGVKIAYLYLLDNVDNAGVWDPDLELANFQIGMDVKWDKVQESLGDRLLVLPNGKWHLTRFIGFQYGELNPECKPHQQVIRLLHGHEIKRASKGYPKGINTPKDKDKDKDKDKSEGGVTAEQVYEAYPRKVARPVALASIKKAAEKLNANGLLDGHEDGMSFLLDRTNSYAKAVARWKPEDREFAPHPSTWFNQERYLDEESSWTRHGSGAPVAHKPMPQNSEPAGWREYVADDMPGCPYAPGQPKHGCAWTDVERVHQDAIIVGMAPKAGDQS